MPVSHKTARADSVFARIYEFAMDSVEQAKTNGRDHEQVDGRDIR